MGRGRQKAKQTKVARKLKYFSPDTDYEALERELSSQSSSHSGDDDPYADLYDKYAEDDDDAQDDEDDNWVTHR